jgi:hypothetical protein
MRSALSFLLAVCLLAPAPGAQAAPGCTQEQAVSAVRADGAFKLFCSGGHGCDFTARAPSPLNADEKNDANLVWVVKASVIHSYSDKGQPLFMPEGAGFAFVSAACGITKTVGPNGPLPAAEYMLDDVGGREFALYPGAAYRSNVEPKYAVTSLQGLEEAAGRLPAGAVIHWVPGLRGASRKPKLFGEEASVQEFEAYCRAHNLKLDFAP